MIHFSGAHTIGNRRYIYIVGSIIDLFFTSQLDRVGNVEVMAPFPNCLHSPIVMDYVFYKDLDHEGRVDGGMKYFDWSHKFAYQSESVCFDHLKILSHLISLYVPLHSGINRVPWSNRPPHCMMREQ